VRVRGVGRVYALRMPSTRTPTHARRACALFGAPLLVLGLGACGAAVSTSGFTGESRAVAQRISDYQADVAAADAGKVCRNDLAAAVRARLTITGGSCAQALKHQLESIDDFTTTVEKGGVVVAGSTATARVRSVWSGKLRTTTLELVKEGGAWRIAGATLK
jgi:hypothetical protein